MENGEECENQEDEECERIIMRQEISSVGVMERNQNVYSRIPLKRTWTEFLRYR